ncbi:MAG: long-chain fatty acid--CoA ligase [Actinobacteria bacterium]|nr:long-chain fatty acid--CoA ligase [Actinomycetota bacterium]
MNLASLIDGHPDDALALISRGRPTTYGVLRQQVASMRGALRAEGVVPGDRVALLCGNSRYFVVSYLAIIGIGAIAVPLNPTSPTPELERELAVVDPKVAVIEPAAESAWAGIDKAKLPSLKLVVTTDGSSISNGKSIDAMLNASPVDVVDVRPDTPAVYMFTSGTAGSPKAAVLTHCNLATNIEQVDEVESITKSDVFYGVLPLFHIFGLNVVVGCALSMGACVVLVQRFDPATAAETIVERGVTVVPGVPSMWAAFAQMPELPADAFAGVRMALSGAAKLPEAIADHLHRRFGLKVYEGYGLTEAAPVVTTSVGDDWIPGSIGQPLPGINVRLVDEDGDDVLVGDTGEVWVNGLNVFVGYLNDAEATNRALTPDGWLRTGDIGVVDENGRLFLVDRAKDLIIVSGFNVFPAEVESVISQHPHVKEVAVVGTPHPHTGETVRAYVVTRDAVHLDEDALVDFCRSRLARYKCPTKVLLVDQIPKNVSGKVLRHSLK